MKLYRINALLLKYWFITRNSLDRVLDIFYWPLIGIIVFGFTTLYIEKISNFPEIFIYLLGGMMMWVIFERNQHDVTTYILEDFWSHNVANSFATPVKESEIFVSVTIVGLIRAIISFLVMVLVAFFAYNFNVFGGGFLALVFVVPLFLFGWGLGILISGLIFKFGMRIQVFAWSISFLMQPLAAVYYPIETLPVFLQKAALFTPLVYVFEGFRMAYKGVFSYHHLFWALGLSILSLFIGFWVFLRCIKSSKKSGLLTNY